MSFNVNLQAFNDANVELNASCDQVERILTELHEIIRPMGEAQWGESLPAWGELQTVWDKEYIDIQMAAVQIKNAAIKVREDFAMGDLRGAALFS